MHCLSIPLCRNVPRTGITSKSIYLYTQYTRSHAWQACAYTQGRSWNCTWHFNETPEWTRWTDFIIHGSTIESDGRILYVVPLDQSFLPRCKFSWWCEHHSGWITGVRLWAVSVLRHNAFQLSAQIGKCQCAAKSPSSDFRGALQLCPPSVCVWSKKRAKPKDIFTQALQEYVAKLLGIVTVCFVVVVHKGKYTFVLLMCPGICHSFFRTPRGSIGEKIGRSVPIQACQCPIGCEGREHRGRGREAGHSCGARSSSWSPASIDKDLGIDVFLLCPYSLLHFLPVYCILCTYNDTYGTNSMCTVQLYNSFLPASQRCVVLQGLGGKITQNMI